MIYVAMDQSWRQVSNINNHRSCRYYVPLIDMIKMALQEFQLWLGRLSAQCCLCENAGSIPGLLSGLRTRLPCSSNVTSGSNLNFHIVTGAAEERGKKGKKKMALYLCDLFFVCFFPLQGHTQDIWRFPGQGSNQSYSCQPTPPPQQCQIQAASATYTTAHHNTRSLTH